MSPACLTRLENDAVKRPSPHFLHQLGETLAVLYAEPDSQEKDRRAVE